MNLKAFYRIGLLFLIAFSLSCKENVSKETKKQSDLEIKKNADSLMNQWHLAATQANFDNYFGLMTEDAVFIGTDANENWAIADFKEFSKPYFDKGQAWDFKTLERNLYVSEDQETVWFDELLDTWMGICRGSGVLTKENELWKIKQYVLSMTIPNEKVNAVIEINKESDSVFKEKLKLKRKKD